MKHFYFTLVTFLFLAVVHRQIVNIPDVNFKAKLLSASASNQIASTQTPNASGLVSAYSKIDINNDGQIQLSEAQTIKYLAVTSSSISSLLGIGAFSNLESLYCGNNQLATLDVSGLLNLKTLFCNYNQLTNLNMTGLYSLTTLYCHYNQLQSLNVTGLPNLRVLDCRSNSLTTLFIKNNNLASWTYLEFANKL